MFTWRYTLDSRDVGSVSDLVWHGPNMEPLEVQGPNDVALINAAGSGMERYVPLLPVDPATFQTLGAGPTPLIEGQLVGKSVLFKLDSLLPSGSFKDRGAAVSVSLLASTNAQRVVVDSSGNAAAAMSAYCAAYGIECVVYAPATASAGKLIQSQAYGADVRLVDGPREAVASAAQAAGSEDAGARYISHNWSPLFAEGVKTWALEVWEQLGQRSPDRVFVPTGGGSALMGALRGFAATGTLPRIIASQPAACAPLALAFQHGQRHLQAVSPGETIAEGARISAPPRDYMLTDALEQSQGAAVAIDEPELVNALRALWNQGIYAEPTAGLGAAAFIKAVERGDDMSGTNVVLVTGSGLKSTDVIGTILG